MAKMVLMEKMVPMERMVAMERMVLTERALMNWNDAKRTLTIDARRGCYEGMLDERKFTVRIP